MAAIFVVFYAEAVSGKQRDQPGVVFQLRVRQRAAVCGALRILGGLHQAGVLVGIVDSPAMRIGFHLSDLNEWSYSACGSRLVVDEQQGSDKCDAENQNNYG